MQVDRNRQHLFFLFFFLIQNIMFNSVYQIPYLKKQEKKKKNQILVMFCFSQRSQNYSIKEKKKCLTHISSPTSETFHFQRHQIGYHTFPFANKLKAIFKSFNFAKLEQIKRYIEHVIFFPSHKQHHLSNLQYTVSLTFFLLIYSRSIHMVTWIHINKMEGLFISWRNHILESIFILLDLKVYIEP